MTRTVGALVTLAICLLAQAVSGAEIKVYSTIGVKSALEELATEIREGDRQQTQHHLGPDFSYLRKRLRRVTCRTFWLCRAPASIALTKDGKIAAGSDATLAKSVFAIAVKRGAPKPDISSAEAFKNALLAARAVGYTDPAAGGASGVHFAKVLERMGIAAEIKAKSKFPPPAVSSGHCWSAVRSTLPSRQKPEVTFDRRRRNRWPVAWRSRQHDRLFAAGVGASSPSSEAAKALVKFLTLAGSAGGVHRARLSNSP